MCKNHMKPNVFQELNCIKKGMCVWGGKINLMFDKFYNPLHFMFNIYNGLN